jgi:hypothetical protein
MQVPARLTSLLHTSGEARRREPSSEDAFPDFLPVQASSLIGVFPQTVPTLTKHFGREEIRPVHARLSIAFKMALPTVFI